MFASSNKNALGIMKNQTRPLQAAGSFLNNLLGNNATEPAVGMPCTILLYTDRRAYEVIAVAEDGKACTIRAMKAKRTDSNGLSEMQTYAFESNENGATHQLVWRKNRGSEGGRWKQVTEQRLFSDEITRRADRMGLASIRQALTEEEQALLWPCLEQGKSINHVPGLTQIKRIYQDVSIIFGEASEYIDPSF